MGHLFGQKYDCRFGDIPLICTQQRKMFMEEKKIMTGGLEKSEILDKVATYYDDRLAIIEDVGKIKNNNAVRMNIFVVMLCHKGKGSVWVNDQSYDFKENDLLICLPNDILEHNVISADFQSSGFLMAPGYIFQLMSFRSRWDFKLYLETHPVFSLNAKEVEIFNQYFNLLRSKLRGEPCKYQKEVIDSLVQAFMYELGSSMERFMESEHSYFPYSSGNNLFQAFLDVLSSSYPKKRMVSVYADKLHVTPKYLSSVCKEVSRHTASEWINWYVMKDVEYQLKRTRKSIKEVANELEFPSLSFFGKYVKRYLGMSPREYREKLRDEIKNDEGRAE